MFLSQLTNIVTDLSNTFSTTRADRNAGVVISRFGLNHGTPTTLEEIGNEYGLTRERVRQIEQKYIKILKEVILTGEYSKTYIRKEKSYSLDPNLFQEVKQIIENLPLDKIYFSKTEMEQFFGADFERYRGEITLLLYCLNYEWHRIRTCYKFVLSDGWVSFEKKELVSHFISTLSNLVPNVEINLHKFIESNKVKLNIDEVLLILENVDGLNIKQNENQYFIQIDFSKLSTLDKVDFLLRDKHQLAIEEIAAYLNKHSVKTYQPNNIRNQMSSDSRFTPIGKSGFWALRSRSPLENISIADAIEKIFLNLNEPLTKQEITTGVKALRGNSFKEKSIETYLNIDERFCSLGRGLFALTRWNLPRLTERIYRKRRMGFEQNLLEVMGLNKFHPLIQIVRHFTEQDWNEVTVRSRLTNLKNKGYLVVSDDPNQNQIMLVKSPVDVAKEHKKAIITTLQNKIIEFLSQHKDQVFQKGELYRLIDPDRKYIVQTFYQALSRIEDEHLHSYTERHKFYVVYKSE